MERRYGAPWCPSLAIVSLLATVLCLGAARAAMVADGGPAAWVGWMLVAIPAASALFTIRGYTITREAILIHRLLWDTRLPLSDLFSAEHDPKAMRGSIRLCGNGGFYSFTGLYRNRRLGSYRPFVTDPRRAVVLRCGRRTYVLSPDAPDAFVRDLGALGPAAPAP